MTQRTRFAFADGLFHTSHAHGGAAPIQSRRVAESATGSACNWIDLVIVPPGADIGEHAHGTGDEETYVIIEGRGHMRVDGESMAVGPGDVIINRPGGTHALINDGPAEMKLVVVDVRVA